MDELTKDADTVSLVIILHQELVTVHYVLGEVPRKRLVQDSSTEAENRRNHSGLEVRPDASLCSPQSGRKSGTGGKCAPGNNIAATREHPSSG